MRIYQYLVASCAWTLALSAAEIPFDRSGEFPLQAFSLIGEKRVVWFGEVHGTREAPALFLGLVKLISKHGPAPVVALEIPSSEQAAIDGYLDSGDDSHLRANSFFKAEFRDGRSSQAFVRLISDLRKQKVAAVVCFDATTAKSAQERDFSMAQNLRLTAARYPSAKLVVLSGNVHSRVVKGTDWDPAYHPAAFELSHHIKSLVSLTIAYEAGTAWVLTEDGFGERQLRGKKWSGAASHYITVHPQPLGGHHGVIFTRTLTGSPPW